MALMRSFSIERSKTFLFQVSLDRNRAVRSTMWSSSHFHPPPPPNIPCGFLMEFFIHKNGWSEFSLKLNEASVQCFVALFRSHTAEWQWWQGSQILTADSAGLPSPLHSFLQKGYASYESVSLGKSAWLQILAVQMNWVVGNRVWEEIFFFLFFPLSVPFAPKRGNVLKCIDISGSRNSEIRQRVLHTPRTAFTLLEDIWVISWYLHSQLFVNTEEHNFIVTTKVIL